MKRRRNDKTPLKQSRISNFFSRGDDTSKTKRSKTDEKNENVESPDVISCTPPSKTSLKARKSLDKKFFKNDDKFEKIQKETAKMENCLKIGSVLKKIDNIENDDVKKIDDFDSAIPENSPILKSPLKSTENIIQFNSEKHIDSDDFGFDDIFIENWSTQNSTDEQVQYVLDFSSCIKCIVVSSETAKHGSLYETTLIVKSNDESKYGRVILRDMWVFCELFANDEISIVAQLISDIWVVNALNGYISIFPDSLIPSTSLVGSMFCRRRGILSNIFKGLDSDSPIMTIGSLAHELFQKALELPNCTKDHLEKIIDNLLTFPNYIRMLYSCDMSCEDAKKELNIFVPFILNFLKIYVTKEIKPEGKNFQGTITEIVDIEESVSCVNIGFKGRIDVTVNVKINGKVKKMPLELKTGRASFSNEHRCQVILYTIMMSGLGEKIDSGLLMYLKEGILEEIKATRVEIRDMIILRNDFVRYLKQFEKSILPEPIRLANSCKKCPYLTVCCAYLDNNISETHPIKTVIPEIEATHLEYFYKWSKLLLLENSIENNDGNLKLSGIILEKGFVKIKNDFKYSFKKTDDNILLSAGSFVQLSPTNKTNNYFGRIVQITANKCSVVFDKEIIEDSGTVFNLQGFQSSLLPRYMTNLGCLLEERHSSLRKIVIDQEPSDFEPKIPKSLLSSESINILSKLNEDQQRAILKALACKNYLLIEGPPGSGKTQTIAALVKVLISLKQTVLVVGHTHSSVDNILLRLKDVNFLRLGNVSNIHSELLDKSYGVLSKTLKSVTDIEKLFNIPVIASTCLGLDSDIIAKKKFDVCIVDESSQVLQPEVLKPLFAAKKFVLIGDKKQLRPVVKNIDAQKHGMNISIFEHLYKPESIITLKYQYRMNAILMDIPNKLTYNNILKVGNNEVGKAVLKLKTNSSFQWLQDIMSTKLIHSIIFVDTSDYLNYFSNDISSCTNLNEAKIVETIVNEFINCGINENDIGVMAPFRAQIQILKDLMPSNVEVNTIDQYQGRDKNCIIFSSTKQDRSIEEKGDYELLNDERRITVAITRAKYKLIIVGDKLTLMRYQTFKKLFSFINHENIIELKEGKNEFSWLFLQDCSKETYV